MAEIITKSNITDYINELLNESKKINIYGLPYKPYYDGVSITNKSRCQVGFISTNSGIYLDATTRLNQIKIHTISGWSRLFSRDQDGNILTNITNIGGVEYVEVKDVTQVCPGMILRVKMKDGSFADRNPLILDVEPILNDCGSTVGYNFYGLIEKMNILISTVYEGATLEEQSIQVLDFLYVKQR